MDANETKESNESDDSNGSLYSARDVAQVIGIAESRVASWVRSGLVAPSEKRGARRYFNFADLIAVKAVKELVERGVSPQRVKRNLMALRGALPSGAEMGTGTATRTATGIDRPLSRLRVISDGEKLVVVGDDVVFEPLSGQVVMDFAVETLSSRAAEVMALPRAQGPGRGSDAERSAWEWFLEGVAREDDGREAEAAEAWGLTLALDPHIAAAHTNLGNLAHRAGRRGEARERYQAALAIDPEQPEARYNLANLLDEIGDHTRAVEEWRKVTALAPEFADAHFNLGAALVKRGSISAARASLARYLELDGSGTWAEVARSMSGKSACEG